MTSHSSGSGLRPATNVTTRKHKQEDAEAQPRSQPVPFNLDTHWTHRHRYTRHAAHGKGQWVHLLWAELHRVGQKRNSAAHLSSTAPKCSGRSSTSTRGDVTKRTIRKRGTSDLLVFVSVPQWEEASSLQPHFRHTKKVRSVSVLGAGRHRRRCSTWKHPPTGRLSDRRSYETPGSHQRCLRAVPYNPF